MLTMTTVDLDVLASACQLRKIEHGQLLDRAAENEAEFWLEAIPALFDAMRDVAREHGIRIMNGDCFEITGVYTDEILGPADDE